MNEQLKKVSQALSSIKNCRSSKVDELKQKTTEKNMGQEELRKKEQEQK